MLADKIEERRLGAASKRQQEAERIRRQKRRRSRRAKNRDAARQARAVRQEGVPGTVGHTIGDADDWPLRRDRADLRRVADVGRDDAVRARRGREAGAAPRSRERRRRRAPAATVRRCSTSGAAPERCCSTLRRAVPPGASRASTRARGCWPPRARKQRAASDVIWARASLGALPFAPGVRRLHRLLRHAQPPARRWRRWRARSRPPRRCCVPAACWSSTSPAGAGSKSGGRASNRFSGAGWWMLDRRQLRRRQRDRGRRRDAGARAASTRRFEIQERYFGPRRDPHRAGWRPVSRWSRKRPGHPSRSEAWARPGGRRGAADECRTFRGIKSTRCQPTDATEHRVIELKSTCH